MSFIKNLLNTFKQKLLKPILKKLFFQLQINHLELKEEIKSLKFHTQRLIYLKTHFEKNMFVSNQLKINPKYHSLLSLNHFEYQIHSQSGEDGIIQEIFRRIGVTNNYFIEFGASSGTENNTSNLLNLNWLGLWIEIDKDLFQILNQKFNSKIQDNKLKIINAAVTAENIQSLFAQANVPKEIDLLSIDIDGNDYWVWKAITDYNPRVVIMEYNQSKGPTEEYFMPYNPDFFWDGTHGNYGISLKSVELLGKEKGYNLVGCGILGPNAFLVRKDLCKDLFQEPYTSEFHFSPANSLTYAFEVSPFYKDYKF